MAVDGRRRIVKTTYLYYTSLSIQALSDIIANQFTQQIVVTTDKSSILLRLRLTIDKNHRNALLLCSFEGRRNSIHLIGRNDEQTDTLVDKVIDLRQLTVIIVIGRSQTHLY
ncbi:unknown [Prevotella sp. CAG:386]|nr:unknown [Prevotella sp. CAG:386]